MSHIFASFGRRSMLILFVVGRGCGGLAPTVFSRIIICSMCVGMSECVCVAVWVCVLAIYGLQLFACSAGIALSGYAGKFYVLACFTFQLASFVRTEKLFNMPRTAMADDDTGGQRDVCGGVPHCHGAHSTKVCQGITCCFYGIRHTDTTIQTHVHLSHTSID